MALRAVIVDDEPLARRRLTDLLEAVPEVELIAEASASAEALRVIRDLAPDLVFLDVEMPEMNGLELVAQLDPERRPQIVFATAYDAYGVDAFDAAAVDYLMKPISAERLRQSIDRVLARRELAGRGQSEAEIEPSGIGEDAGAGHRLRLAVRKNERFLVVDVGTIAWIEAADNYVRIHAPEGPFLYRCTMAEMERSLDPSEFLRIHRSIIIRIDQVRAIEPWGLGEYSFVLAAGKRLVSSRTYRANVRRVFGI
jgi:two-component system, LytTR family, response regulator